MLARKNDWTEYFSKKIPPYAKPLEKLQRQGKKPANSINIFIGKDAWLKGKNFSKSYPNRTIILPPWDTPDYYLWPVNECCVLIFDTSGAEEDYVMELVVSLYRNGAQIVRFVNNKNELVVYRLEE